MDDRVGPGFDAAMITVDGFVPADLGMLEAGGLLLGGEEFDVFAQGPLIAFEGEDVIGPLVHDLLGDVALTAHGIDGDDGALDRQHVEQLGDRHDLIGFFRHLELSEHEPLARREGRDRVDRQFRALLRAGTA